MKLPIFAIALIVFSTLAVQAEPWRRHTIDDSSRGADGVRLADVNGDRLADITTGWEEGTQVRVVLNPGPAKAKAKWAAVTVGKVKSAEDAVFADLDGDGAIDVLSSCEGGTRSLFVHWAPANKDQYLDASSWSTEPIPAAEKQQMWMFALPIDVDGHAGVDVVVGSKGPAAAVSWLQLPANPRKLAEWKLHKLVDAGWIMSLQAHDMDGDGDRDVLFSDRKGKRRGVKWLENPGAKATAGGAPWPEHVVGGQDREVMFLAVGDLDQDQRSDVVCAVRGRGFAWFQRKSEDGKSWKTHEIEMPDNCGTGKGVAIGDMNGDGQQDLVFSCENASGGKSGVRWLSYNKSPAEAKWQDHEISGPAGVKFDRLELIDLDADGDLDVLTCEERNQLGVVWYENPGVKK